MGFVLLAELSAHNGDLEGAVGYYLQIAKETKRDELFEKAVQYGLRLGASDRLLDIGRTWTTYLPQSPKAALYWWSVLVRVGQYSESVVALKSALATNELGVQQALLLELPVVYGTATPLPGTIKAVARATLPYRTNPSTALQATIGLARLHLVAADTAAALTLFEQVGVLNATHPATVSLAFELLNHRVLQVKPWLIAQIEQHGDRQTVLAYMQWQQKNEGLRATLNLLERVWTQHPKDAAVGLLIARYQMAASRWGAAQTTLQRAYALALTPGPAAPPRAEEDVVQEICMLLAQLALKQYPPGAVDTWLERVTDSSFDQDVRQIRMTEWIQKGQLDKARQWLNAPSDKSDGIPDDYHALWEAALTEQGHYSEALTSLERRIQKAPDDKNLLLSRSVLLLSMGELEPALKQLRQLHQRFPSDALVQNALGFTLADRQMELAFAKTLITQASDALRDNATVLDSMGWVEYRLGNLDTAVYWLERAMALAPDPEIAAHLGEVLWYQDRKEAAVAVWREAYDTLSPHKELVQTLQRLGVRLP